MNKAIPVWFTAGYSNLYRAQEDIRAADVLGQFKLLASHSHPDFVGLAAADVALKEPICNGAAYLSFIKRVARQHGVRVLIPSRKQGLLHAHKEELESLGLTVATVASSQTLQLINDKAALYKELAPLHLVRVPQFETARTGSRLADAVAKLEAQGLAPCMKPVKGVYGSGFRIIETRRKDTVQGLVDESLKLSLKNILDRAAAGQMPNMLVMQYLEGAERSVDCLAYHGQLVGGVIRRKSPFAGDAQIIERNEELMAQVAAIAKHFQLNGLFNVQFKDSGGVSYLLEINTRLSGRSFYATLAGMNLPYLAALLFSGESSLEEVAAMANSHVSFGMRIGNVSTGVVLPSTFARGSSTECGRESC